MQLITGRIQVQWIWLIIAYNRKKYSGYDRVLLLCSEPTPEQCHRRLLAEAISSETGFDVIHI